MTVTPPAGFAAFFEAVSACVLVVVETTEGSTPREAGAAMAVSPDTILGTIGGGQLEFRAIAHARAMIDAGGQNDTISIALGPQIGQCCGGRVSLSFQRISKALAARLVGTEERAERDKSHVYIFGAGHVGRALAAALAPLPVTPILCDTRPEIADELDPALACRVIAIPEDVIRDAPPKSAFVILTHDHGLDYLIALEALKRTDAAYVGLIGSATKRAVFEAWIAENDHDRALAARLVCPIGGAGPRDKRPAVIAALTAAEILAALGGQE